MLRKLGRISIGILLAALLTSCGSSGSYRKNDAVPEFDFSQAGETEVEYEVPKVAPNIVINRLGYEPGSEKVAIFRGENVPEEFTIRDVQTDEVVYTGKITPQGYDKAYQEYDSYGDFSALNELGNYYLQADGIGQSYPFMIHDKLYYSLLQSAIRQFETLRMVDGTDSGSWNFEPDLGESEKITRACMGIYRMLVAYEMTSGAYRDNTGIKDSGNQIPDILDICMSEMDWVLSRSESITSTDSEYYGRRAAALARMAYMMRAFDEGAAAKYQEAAEKAYAEFLSGGKITYSIKLLAETEMYRMTGVMTYRNNIDEQLSLATAKKESYPEPVFWAVVTYLNTKSSVDVDLCEQMIHKIMSEAEELTGNSKTNNYFVYSEEQAVDLMDLLDKVIRICVVNCIIPNHEYSMVIDNHVDYFMGRNPSGFCYASGWNGREIPKEDIFMNPLDNASLVFILGQRLVK